MRSKNAFRMIRLERGTRYYLLILQKDLLGDWILTKVNGRIGEALGKIVHETIINKQEAEIRFDKLINYRINHRKYDIKHLK